MMVPIQPEGAVHLDLLKKKKNNKKKDEKTHGIQAGTVLVFSPAPDDEVQEVEVYKKVSSTKILRTEAAGFQVTAAGPPEEVDGYTMLPIEPSGAVVLDHFTVVQK